MSRRKGNRCVDCGAEISDYSTRCHKCAAKPRRSDVRDKIIKVRLENPCLTGVSIARQFSISPERVRQFLTEANLPSAHFYNYNRRYICLNCGNEFVSAYPKRFCSPECRHRYYWILVECEVCGKLFEIRKSALLRQDQTSGRFCSRECRGRWLGKNYGRGRAKRPPELLEVGE
jgi:transcription elongation factor Elf1